MLIKTLKIIGIGLLAIILIGVIYFYAKKVPSLSKSELTQYQYKTLKLPNGIEVNYDEQGNNNAPVVLLIHGGGASLGDWDKWMPKLTEKYHVIRVDMPAHGLTDRTVSDTYTPQIFGDFIADVVKALNLNNFVIVGHSFGGDSVMRYLLNHNNTAKGVVLLGSGGFMLDEDKMTETERALKDMADSPLMKVLLIPNIYFTKKDEFAEGIKEYFYNDDAMTDEYIEKLYNLSLYGKTRGGFQNLVLDAMVDYKNLENLESIKIPALLLWGNKDNVAPLSIAERFKNGLPNATYIEYKNVGHMITEEHPESINDVMDFLEKINAKPQ